MLLASVLAGKGSSASCASCYISGKMLRYPLTRRLGKTQEPQIKNLWLCWESNSARPVSHEGTILNELSVDINLILTRRVIKRILHTVAYIYIYIYAVCKILLIQCEPHQTKLEKK